MRTATIDLNAYRANIARLRELTGTPFLIAVVKADAYGHGAVTIGSAAAEAGVDMLGVVDLDEALALIAAGIELPVLAWLHPANTDFTAAIELDVRIGVSSLDQLEAVIAAARRLQRTAIVHLKVETGLNRSGARQWDWSDIVTRAAAAEADGTVQVEGLFSHLANASMAANRSQGARFAEAIEVAAAAGLNARLIHLAASEAALTDASLGFNALRLGIASYGLSPLDADTPASTWGLTPVMTLASEVALINPIEAGSGVSYGHDWVAPADTRLALVPVGYADGLPRSASNRAEVAIGGVRYPVRGRIAMDQIVVEIGDAEVQVGDPVVIWGDPATGAPTADDWARWAGTIGYELVTKVGRRVRYRLAATE